MLQRHLYMNKAVVLFISHLGHRLREDIADLLLETAFQKVTVEVTVTVHKCCLKQESDHGTPRLRKC